MKRGSIELARRLCVEIVGFTDENNDIDGHDYGSVDIAEILSAEVERLRARFDAAPVAIMDTRDVLGICAPTEDAFQALYALQGKRVRLVLDKGT
jgi:hypothetical protein